MEIERLKALEMYAQREAKQKQDRRLGASVITDQIKERPNPNPNPNPNANANPQNPVPNSNSS